MKQIINIFFSVIGLLVIVSLACVTFFLSVCFLFMFLDAFMDTLL